MVKDLQKRLAERKLGVESTNEAKAWLVKQGYDPIYGARLLRRAIERYVENPLSSKLLRGEFSPGDTVTVSFENDNLVFTSGVAKAAK